MLGGAFLIFIMILLSFVMTALAISNFKQGAELWKVTLLVMSCAFTYIAIFDCISILLK